MNKKELKDLLIILIIQKKGAIKKSTITQILILFLSEITTKCTTPLVQNKLLSTIFDSKNVYTGLFKTYCSIFMERLRICPKNDFMYGKMSANINVKHFIISTLMTARELNTGWEHTVPAKYPCIHLWTYFPM